MQSSQFDFGHHDQGAGRLAIRAVQREPEESAVARLRESFHIDAATRLRIERRATELILAVRARDRDIGQIESLLREYDLSSDEGVVLMMLAEALLRIPDAATRDLLIRDKLGGADFDQHLGKSASTLVNLSTWALAMTGKTIRAAEGQQTWQRLMARLGEPVLRGALLHAMALMGEHFVLGRTIEDALVRAEDAEQRGFRHSYDMLGEAALTARDAARYFDAYDAAIRAIGRAGSDGPIAGPGISIKLSALHPRYEPRQRERVLAELYPRVLALAAAAKARNIGCTIDAEEADRLDLSLDVIGRLIRAAALPAR